MICKSTLAVSAALASCLFASGSLAQDGGGRWAFAVGAGTDNRTKNVSKSDGDGFVYALTEWSAPGDLFYAGAGVETIRSGGSDVEVQANIGFRPQLGGFDLDLKAAHRWRVDSDPGVDDAAWEFTANVSRSIGPASGRLQLQHSPDGAGAVRAWTWVEGRLGWDFSPRLQGTVALGRREQNNAPDYTGWNAGLRYAVTRNIDLDVRYHDTDAKGPGVTERQYGSALIAVLDMAF